MVRIFKIFHVVHYSPGILVTGRALKKSVNAISLLFLFILMVLLVSSSFMYWFEAGTHWNNDLKQWEKDIGNSTYVRTG